MKYCSVSVFSKKWGLSPRTVRFYCLNKKITGVFKIGKTWNIPSEAKPPIKENKKVKPVIDLNNKKRFLVLGGGISGVISAILIKQKYPNATVEIFEQKEKLLKKIYATGNGKCNFSNSGPLVDKYNNPGFALKILKEFPYQTIVSFFSSLGVASKCVGELIYPYSETALSLINALLRQVERLKINVHLLEAVVDFDKQNMFTEKGSYPYDYLIISCGGKASPNLGSNGGIFPVLKCHGVVLKTLKPSLCPIKVKEDVKKLEGLRVKARVLLYNAGSLIHQEDGEVLFKKDGLSGIVIFNMTHFINRQKSLKDLSLTLDFVPDIKEIKPNQYQEYLHPRLANYLIEHDLAIHDTRFSFSGLYDFNNAQVTSGGVLLNQVTSSLCLKKDPHVFLTGEVLDVDGVCGGFNLMWAIASAMKLAQCI